MRALSLIVSAATCFVLALPVHAQVVIASSQSGTAVFGTGSKAIKNVAAPDTIDGVQATLGAGGNAIVSLTKPLQAGFALNTTTGALTTTNTTPIKSYSVSYTICAAANTSDCQSALEAITVVSSVATLPIAGSAVVGTSPNGVPIEDVAIPDTVDGVAATVGGNATVSQGAGWPGGLTLNPATGEIDSDQTVAPGTYTLPYTICNASAPSDCQSQNATVLMNAQAFQEMPATPQTMGDVEFDFGRDGVPCPTCNWGDGNDRANWTDRDGHIWIAHLDITTGQFTTAAQDEQADHDAYFWKTYGNGPEWAFSTPTPGGQVVSSLVYSRFQPGQTAPPPPPSGYAGAGFTTQTGFNSGGSANWQPEFFPGAIEGGGKFNSNLPEASQCNTDPVPTAIWKSLGAHFNLYTEAVSLEGTPAIMTLPPGVTSNGIGERFVPCTHQLLFQADTLYGNSGTQVQQVFWHDLDTGVFEQLTTDDVDKFSGFMFQAPDFGDNYIFYTVAAHKYIQVYEQTGTNADGSPAFTLVNTIYSPLIDQQYLNTSEPFINCTPTCTTYAFITISTGASQQGIQSPNGLAVVALSPATPMFEILVSTDVQATRQRLDPEYFITPQGPYIYYNRIIPLQKGKSGYQNQGEYFIDMQLGAPSGTCVGSSAEDGLPPDC
jgi:hypothetical protein